MATWPLDHSRTESSHPVSRHPLRARECARGSATRLLLVDDHTLFRELLALRLTQEPDFRVIAEASSLAEIRQELRQVAVDVALVELALPDGGGVELIRDLRTLNPEARVVVVTASEDRHERAVAFAAGASGVLSKTAHAAEIIAAIRQVRAGDALLSTHEVVELFRLVDEQREAEHTAHRLVAQLTPRERELLQLLAEGLDDAAMAERLGISHKTVRNYMVHILDKFNVDSRLQALVLAARHGLVTLE
jgi:two-component system, NarL family, nitrate/nitrite response regulator NarL